MIILKGRIIMNIISTQYSLKYKSFEIILSGCKGVNGKHCEGCHSPETWDFNVGRDYKEYFPSIRKKILNNINMIDWVWIYGGEPLDQDLQELITLLQFINIELKKDIMLFTRYGIANLVNEMLPMLRFIKCGEYIKDLDKKIVNVNGYDIELASSNQYVITPNGY
jgi:organic radical activating enzyme